MRDFAAAHRRLTNLVIGLFAIHIAVACSAAQFSGPTIELAASNANGQATFVVPLASGYWYDHGQSMSWDLDIPAELYDPTNGNYIGTIVTCGVNLQSGRSGSTVGQIQIDLGILCDAGAGDTTILANSPQIMRRTIPATYAQARATAQVTVSDLDGNFARATSADVPGDGMARFTMNGVYPTNGTTFSHLVGLVFAGAFGSSTGGQNDPPFGYRPVGFDVNSIGSRVSMRITQNDIAFISCRMDLPNPPPSVYACNGDVDLDGFIDLTDLSAVAASFGIDIDSPGYNFDADFNEDGIVNLNDLSPVLVGFGQECQ